MSTRSYSQFLHRLKDVQNYYLESKQITEFQSLCDDRDGNTNIDARRNYYSRGNQPFKPKNFQTPNANFESSKNSVNAVSGDRKSEWVVQKPVASQIRCFHCKMPNHKRYECPRLQPRSNNCARVGLESQRISGSQFVIQL